ncbi:hypothetical protein NA78x_002320 [Anatilimnocola sp. NA78]|uniref:hypothetical protein n=1 Tax=Anatilimnocola sp. NA78 TaxID=3415683 RepID=UPI003CE49244
MEIQPSESTVTSFMLPAHRPVIRLGTRDCQTLFVVAGALFLLVVCPWHGEWRLTLGGAMFGSLFAWAGYQHRHYERTYRLRLIPGGIRVTSCGSTKNYPQPVIVRPRALPEAHRFSLKSGTCRGSLDLRNFRRADQARIIEHCSQFLSPAQQADSGQQWAYVRARLLVPPKPVDWLKLWQATCIATAACIVLMPLLMSLAEAELPAGESVWSVPEVRQIFQRGLIGMVFFGPAFFLFVWLAHWWGQRTEIDAT